MKRYSKIIDGIEVVKFANEIVIKAHGMQTFNPSEDMIFADGWDEYIEPTYMPTLEDLRARKIAEILAYDSSSEVNEFSIGGQPVWLDKATRAGLMLRFQAENAAGLTTTSLWYEGMQFTLPLETAMQMLYGLELYASACYDNTQAHIASVNAMETIDAVNAYDYTTGYPAKLEFNG